MNISPNGYYNYKKDKKADYRRKKQAIKDKILEIYHEHSGNPGYRIMKIYLSRKKIFLSRTTVLKYMRELKIRSTVIPKRPAYKKGECYKKFDNYLKREFHAAKINQKWCTDFTYILYMVNNLSTS